MSQVLWSPFRELEYVLGRYNRSYGAAPATGDNAKNQEASARPDWIPSVDIAESVNEFLLGAELPAVKREDVKVSVDKGVLTISGERRLEKPEGEFKHSRVERAYGKFRRSFSLPENVDENAIRAEYKDGVLTLRIPKIPKQEPKSIEVQVH